MPNDEDSTELDPLSLANQLCFALYSASNAVKKAYRPLLDELGLTYPQYLILLVLWKSDGLNVSEIGDKLRLDSGTLTPVLKRLENAGLVSRTRRLHDEREVEVRLTATGRDLRDKAPAVHCEILRQLRMSNEAIGRLREELNSITAALHEQN